MPRPSERSDDASCRGDGGIVVVSRIVNLRMYPAADGGDTPAAGRMGLEVVGDSHAEGSRRTDDIAAQGRLPASDGT